MIGLPETGPNELLLPARAYLTPSSINPWRAARHPEQRYTHQQLRTMPLYQLDPATCEDVIVRSSASQSEHWWPAGTPAPVFLLPCPIIQRRGDGSQCLVLSPAGMKKWVYSDGSITKRRIGDKRELRGRFSGSRGF